MDVAETPKGVCFTRFLPDLTGPHPSGPNGHTVRRNYNLVPCSGVTRRGLSKGPTPRSPAPTEIREVIQYVNTTVWAIQVCFTSDRLENKTDRRRTTMMMTDRWALMDVAATPRECISRGFFPISRDLIHPSQTMTDKDLYETKLPPRALLRGHEEGASQGAYPTVSCTHRDP